jgi:uncharacterized protein involved in type VI secretion and phage assembly
MPGGTADCQIKINGASLTADELADVVEVVVNTDLHLPGMFTIVLQDAPTETTGKPGYVDLAKFDIGKEVEVLMAVREEHTDVAARACVLIKGEITALEPAFDTDTGIRLMVRGYDKAHRLHRGQKTRSFLKMSDSDIVKKVAGEAGLTVQADSTSVVHDYVLQYNQTNWDFLRARAERTGYQLYVIEGKLLFKKGDTQTSGPTLEWGLDLRRFEPRLSSAGQLKEATSKGWDLKQKKEIVGQIAKSQAVAKIGYGKDGGAASNTFGTAKGVSVNTPVSTVDEAKLHAQARIDLSESEFVQAEGVCHGNPNVQAGKQIEIKGVGTRFTGKYVVTSATHIFDRGKYETRFSITGREEYTLSRLVQSGGSDYQATGRAPGVVVGLVTNTKDPETLGRIKVKFPWLSDTDESEWARVASPMAGKERGFFFPPEVNDEVLIAFDHDDVNYPYVMGYLWNGKDKPPETNSDGKNDLRLIKSRSGHLIQLNDKPGEEQIVIRDKTGKNEIVINSKDNTMAIKVDKDFTIEAKGNVSIKTNTGDMTLECNNFNVKAKSKVAMEGKTGMELKTTAQMKIEGTAGAELKGTGPVKVESTAILELKGTLVKIN